MKPLKSLIVAMSCAVCSPVVAQPFVPQTRTQLQSQNTATITTNGVGGITGAILRSMIGNFISSANIGAGLQNQIAWFAAGGYDISGLATAVNSILVTNGSGIPSLSTTLPAAVQSNITQTGTLTGGATGSGFTVALGASTVTGNLSVANLNSGTGASAATVWCGNGTWCPAAPPAVSTNAALKALTAGIFPFVLRQGFYVLADSPPVGFIWSGTACSLFSGAGDNGSQVAPTVGVGCWLAQPSSTFNVRSFGATGRNATDDTAPIQNAINAAIAAGSNPTVGYPNRVYIPAGQYDTTATLTASAAVTIEGDYTASQIVPALNINAISETGTGALVVKGIKILYPTASNSNIIGINVNASSGTNTNTNIQDVEIDNCYNPVVFANSSFFKIDGLHAYTFAGTAVTVSNAVNVDVGDSILTNSIMFGSFSGPNGIAGVQFISSGGLKIVNNKFASSTYGVLFQLASAAVTAQMVISENSFDTIGLVGISLTRQGTTGTFNSVIIDHNMFASSLNAIIVPLDATGIWLSDLVISGNTYVGINSASAKAFQISSTNAFNISNNTLISNNTSSVAISTSVSADTAVIGPNIKINVWAANSISSTNTTTIAPN